jgi:lipid-A-disaccharide synthase
MPGSRPNEIKYGLPFFLAVAHELRSRRPGTPISFVLSPFNGDEEIGAALSGRQDPRMYGIGGTLAPDGAFIEVRGERFPIDRSGDYRTVADSRLVITIPGTKCIEAAVLGRPMLVVVPLNRADAIAVNGLAGYLHLVPLVGRPLKSMVVRAAERRFKYVTQPNIDADREIVPEMRGILHPADVAAKAASMLDEPSRLDVMSDALLHIYAKDVGAAGRMADEALAVAAGQAALRTAL